MRMPWVPNSIENKLKTDTFLSQSLDLVL